MKFLVTRTSEYRDEVKPCEGAVETTVQDWDERTFTSPEEHDKKLGGYSNFKPWLSVGTEHEIIRGPRGGVQGIRRRLEDRTGWEVEIADLAALLEFVAKHGDCIVKEESARWSRDPRPFIEIYDYYRE